MEVDKGEDIEPHFDEPQLQGIFTSLVANNDIVFKSQQRGESELNKDEKKQIAQDLFEKNKTSFLLKFGKYMTTKDLKYFEQFSNKDVDPVNYEETSIVLKDLLFNDSKERSKEVKNRRYAALQRMIEENAYFSEVEMMKRNPLLYDQLVGQYLSVDEIKERDSYLTSLENENVTLVKILLEGIDRNEAESSRKEQQAQENQNIDDSSDEEEGEASLNSSDSDDEASTSKWGEFENEKAEISKKVKKKRKRLPTITASERSLLKEEFVTTMYQNFLNGKDEEFFDYNTIDTDTSFNNTIEMDHDEEDKYFESEDTENTEIVTDSKLESDEGTEDELDIYMKAINRKTQHHKDVCSLAENVNSTL